MKLIGRAQGCLLRAERLGMRLGGLVSGPNQNHLRFKVAARECPDITLDDLG